MEHIDYFVKFALENKTAAIWDCFNVWVSYTGIIISFEEAVEFIRVADNIIHSPQELLDFYRKDKK